MLKKTNNYDGQNAHSPNSTYPKGGVLCLKDSLVVNQTLVNQTKFCCKNPALLVPANLFC